MLKLSVFAAQQNLIYDANGNLITGDGKYREYNVFNQLVKVRQGNSSSGHVLEEYIYDPVEEKVLVKRDYINTSNEVKRFVLYINDNFIREYGSSALPLNDTYYAKDDSGIVGEIRYNGPQNSPKLTKSRKLYYHNDLKTSVSVLTNDSGAVVEQTFYEPYGKILSGGAKERFSYENKEYAPQINTYDFHFRQYQPDWNKFTQPDTLLQNVYDPQLLNRYTFERDNPYKYNDISGHNFIVQDTLRWVKTKIDYYVKETNEAIISTYNSINPSIRWISKGTYNTFIKGEVDYSKWFINEMFWQNEKNDDFKLFAPKTEEDMNKLRENALMGKSSEVIGVFSDIYSLIDMEATFFTSNGVLNWAQISISTIIQNMRNLGSSSPVFGKEGGSGYISGLGYVTSNGKVYPTINTQWAPKDTESGNSPKSQNTCQATGNAKCPE